MRLFLTSSFLTGADQVQRFLQLLGKDPREAKLLFVPTASDDGGPDSLFYQIKTLNDFSALGFSPVWYSLCTKNREDLFRDLQDVDVIWVGGGNTFYLLQEARRSGFLEVVSVLAREKNVLYGGTSAGSILATSSIEIAGMGEDGDVNAVGISDLSALGLFAGSIQVHYESSLHDSFLTTLQRAHPLYVVPDGGAIVVDGAGVELMGNADIMKAE